MIHVVLLSGGSGTRLWPLSNNARSKQFLKVLRDGNGNRVSMVQRVYRQVKTIPAETSVTIATCESQKNSVERQLSGDYSIVLEPERRDTAAAIMLACCHLSMVQGASMDETVVVMPIDTFAEQEYYDHVVMLDKTVQKDNSKLVLLGIDPVYPSSKYGYIIPDEREGESWPVRCFKEKPSENSAKRYIEQGGLWNCGVFAFKLGYLQALTKSYWDFSSFEDLLSHYALLPNVSFDYEIVEKADGIAVVPGSGLWKDLGTWNTLTEEMRELSSGRVIYEAETCKNTHIINETMLPMVVAGIENAAVVATPDGILVVDKKRSAHIKDLVSQAAASRPMYEQRRWGEYRVIDLNVYPDGGKSLSKELVVGAGKQLSYQLHHNRSEVWTVVSGCGEVVLDGKSNTVQRGSIIKVEKGVRHSIRAFDELHVIEVQLGDTLVEEDVERFGDYWS